MWMLKLGLAYRKIKAAVLAKDLSALALAAKEAADALGWKPDAQALLPLLDACKAGEIGVAVNHAISLLLAITLHLSGMSMAPIMSATGIPSVLTDREAHNDAWANDELSEALDAHIAVMEAAPPVSSSPTTQTTSVSVEPQAVGNPLIAIQTGIMLIRFLREMLAKK